MAWIDYTIEDGANQGALFRDNVDGITPEEGRTFIYCPDEMGDPSQYRVDITQTPPVLVPYA